MWKSESFVWCHICGKKGHFEQVGGLAAGVHVYGISSHFGDEKTSPSCHFDDEKLVTQSMSMHISRTTYINVHANKHLHIDVQGCPLSMKEYHQKVVAGVIPGTCNLCVSFTFLQFSSIIISLPFLRLVEIKRQGVTARNIRKFCLAIDC
jgi:hypothetical protein